MITKYIGSVSDFINCEVIEFVMVTKGQVLSIDKISDYTIFNPLFIRHKTAYRDDNGKFIGYFDGNDTGFILNNIIMYNLQGNPIGFVDLTQDIDVVYYGIESLELSFEYVIVDKIIEFNIDVNYIQHEALTKNKLSHKNLFNLSLGENKAISKSELSKLDIDKQLYTKNLIDITRNKDLIYRYSGNLNIDNFKLSTTSLSISKEVVDNILSSEIITFNGSNYLLYSSVAESSITIKKLVTNETTNPVKIKLSYPIVSRFFIGSNYIVLGEGVERRIISTEKLITTYSEVILNRCGFEVIDYSAGKLSDETISPQIQFCKNPRTKELYAYTKTDTDIEPLCEDLRHILLDFKSISTNIDLVYVDKGLIFGAKLVNGIITNTNINGYITDNPIYLTYPLPTEIYGTNSAESDAIKSRFIDLLLDTDINDIVFLSPEVMVINKAELTYAEFRERNKVKYDDDLMLASATVEDPDDEESDKYIYYINTDEYRRLTGSNKFIVYVDSNYNYDPKVTDYQARLSILNLKGSSGVHNYDKIIKSSDSNINKLTLLPLVSDGCIYGYRTYGDDTYYLMKL